VLYKIPAVLSKIMIKIFWLRFLCGHSVVLVEFSGTHFQLAFLQS